MIEENAKSGFTYTVEVVKDGVVVDSEVVHNIMPIEGLNHVLGVTLLGASQVTQWYVGVYENDYTPLPGDDMATFPGLAGESTAYVNATRHALTMGAASGGVSDNSAARTEIEFTATKTIRGGFIASTPTKGATAGVLLSAVKFATPKAVEAGAILRLTAGLQLTSS